MKKQIEHTPNDARTHIFLNVFLSRLGRFDEALEYAKKALKLSPSKQPILFDIGGILLNQGKKVEALAVFKEAFELATTSNEARIIYAVGAMYNKNVALAQELLVPVFGTIEIDDDRVVKALYETGHFTEVLHIWQKRVEKDPASYQKRVSLGAAYYATGDRANSVKQLEEAIKLEPKFKEQGEELIKEIRAGKSI
jgi:tetratricopeptide (TPR) repeat protein